MYFVWHIVPHESKFVFWLVRVSFDLLVSRAFKSFPQTGFVGFLGEKINVRKVLETLLMVFQRPGTKNMRLKVTSVFESLTNSPFA